MVLAPLGAQPFTIVCESGLVKVTVGQTNQVLLERGRITVPESNAVLQFFKTPCKLLIDDGRGPVTYKHSGVSADSQGTPLYELLRQVREGETEQKKAGLVGTATFILLTTGALALFVLLLWGATRLFARLGRKDEDAKLKPMVMNPEMKARHKGEYTGDKKD